jgi:hypothetical protein
LKCLGFPGSSAGRGLKGGGTARDKWGSYIDIGLSIWKVSIKVNKVGNRRETK